MKRDDLETTPSLLCIVSEKIPWNCSIDVSRSTAVMIDLF